MAEVVCRPFENRALCAETGLNTAGKTADNGPAMSDQKQVPVMGRLAVQLKLISPEQLGEALREQPPGSQKPLGTILMEKGFINEAQLAKLQAVQKDLIAKHKAKQAAAAGAKQPETGSARVEARPQPSPRVPPVKPSAAPAASAPSPSPAAAPAPAPAAAPAAVSPPPRPQVQPARPAPLPSQQVAPAAAEQTAAQGPESSSGAAAESLGLSMAEPSESHRERLFQLLRDAVQSGASDVHIHAGAPPKQRVDGVLTDMSPTPLPAAEAEGIVAAALTPDERALLVQVGELDFCLEVDGVGRFRANCYRQHRGFDATFRSISKEPPTLESLGLPEDLARFTTYHQGMVLITGPAGCGKSATLAALVNRINEEREEHILTIEDPIEVVHPSKKCLVNQRHAGKDTASFARALRGALREDPDIIVIGELRDLETISLAMTAAETGHFVLATLHTNNAVRTINRIIGAFPSAEQGQVRTMLSGSLRAVVSQRLVPRKNGGGRVPALEVLVLNRAISNLVREEKTVQIRSAIQTGKNLGMFLLEQSLNDLVKDGTVDKDVALGFAEETKLITG